MRVTLFLFIVLLLLLPGLQPSPRAVTLPAVELLRTPGAGVQPQAILDASGTLHLVYLNGDARESDVWYAKRAAGQATFTAPLRVNSLPGSAVATGTIRGAQLALGKGGRVHVVWNGSQRAASPQMPLLYARLNDAGTAFEPQRNLLQVSHGLDGSGTLAADGAGQVYLAWHGAGAQPGEPQRRIWLARSRDEGRTFARETAVDPDQTGACACCGMRAFLDQPGALFLLYRTATGMTERGMYLLTSTDQGGHFRGLRLDHWTLTSCPMSSVVLANPRQPVAAWENDGQIWFAPLTAQLTQAPAAQAAPGATGKRKHPALAVNARGETLLAWTEGTGWKKGGTLAWQLYDRAGQPVGPLGTAADVPVWDLPTAVALPDNTFTIIY